MKKFPVFFIICAAVAVLFTGCDFIPDSAEVAISGEALIGATLTGTCEFSEDVAEEDLVYSWLVSDNEDGSYIAIGSANAKSYTLTPAEQGRYIKFAVTLTESDEEAVFQSEPLAVPVISVIINDDENILVFCDTEHTFSASVTGAIDSSVTWEAASTVAEDAGEFDSFGTYLAASDIDLSANEVSVTLTAKSAADPQKAASLDIRVSKQVYMLKSFGPVPAPHETQLTSLVRYNDKIYFTVDDGTNGNELWESDGTVAGTIMVKDINPGGDGIEANTPLIIYNNKLYFSGNDGTSGNELWTSDGTAAGTQLVKNIITGSTSSYPANFAVYNNKLYFVASSSSDGRELWTTDGTTDGTVLFKDINPLAGNSLPESLTVFNGKLYFLANDGTNGYELWTSDGTADGTVLFKDINPAGDSNAGALAVLNDTLFFSARSTNDDADLQLWSSDGTADGTTLFKTINNSGTANIGGLTLFNGKLYFHASENSMNVELFVCDGTVEGTQLLKELNPDPDNPSFPMGFSVVNDTLYFTATNGTDGLELWASDGTAAGTDMFIDLNPSGDGIQYREAFIAALDDEKTLLAANDGTNQGIWIFYLP